MREWIVSLTDDADMEKFEREIGTNGELVRCRDCVHYRKWYWIAGKRKTTNCEITGYDLGADGYCSIGRMATNAKKEE